MNTEAGFRTNLTATLTAVAVAALCGACATANSVPQTTLDGLQLVPHSRMERAWVRPGETFRQYDRVALLDCFVAFKKDWRLNHPEYDTYQLDRIKKDIAKAFREVFTTELEKNGYPVVTKPAKDVLLIRPAIIDLEIVAPNTESDVYSMTFTTSAGSMELYVEFYDSETNQILARAADRRAANHIGDVELSSSVSNTADALRLLQHWADLLVSRLNEIHGKKGA
jgi:hypothetical protein